jgi:hypothetical protein
MMPRFEVDLATRLKQSREATNAVRLPRLGYKQYKIYEPEENKDKTTLNNQYGVLKNRPSYSSGYDLNYVCSIIYRIHPDDFVTVPKFKVEWLKPKQATLLRLQGKKVEEH